MDDMAAEGRREEERDEIKNAEKTNAEEKEVEDEEMGPEENGVEESVEVQYVNYSMFICRWYSMSITMCIEAIYIYSRNM